MEIVTGHRGTPHVTPYKVRDFNIGIVGAEDYVMNGGSELEAQLVSNNRIDIKDGSICMQGTHAVIPKNINDELTIENGMQGEKRIDLIVARYEKVADSGVESVNTVVLQGTPSKESPIVPGHVVGDIRNGDLKHEMPLYEVELDGINVIEVRPVFKKIVSAAEQQKMIELLNGNCFHRPGDSFHIGLTVVPAIITGDKKHIIGIINLPKPCVGVTNVELKNVQAIVRQWDNYIYGTTSNYGKISNAQVELRELGIHFDFEIPLNSSAVNNTPVNVQLDCDVIFK